MAQQAHLIGIRGDECQCGRRATIRHCPVCGSSRIYGYSTPQAYTNQRGEVKVATKLYRCLGCAFKFVDEDREFCEAPPVGVKLAAQKVKALQEAKESGEHLRGTEQKIVESIKEIAASDEAHKELSDNEVRNLDFSFRGLWASERYQASSKGLEFPETVTAYVLRRMHETQVPQVVIDRVKAMHEAEFNK